MRDRTLTFLFAVAAALATWGLIRVVGMDALVALHFAIALTRSWF